LEGWRFIFAQLIVYDSSLILGFATGRILLVGEGQLLHYSIRYGPFEFSRAVRGLGPEKGVQESLIPYWTNRVMAWGKYLWPRKFVDAGESDVEAFDP
jgi:hypothetical protein